MRGVEVLADRRKPITDDKAREVLFGAEQYKRALKAALACAQRRSPRIGREALPHCP